MKKITLLLLFLTYISLSFSQSLVKTYYDPFTKTKIKEVFQVKTNTPTINGYYKLYDEYGNLLEHSNYIDNKLNGKFTAYIGANEASFTYGGINSLGKISKVSTYKNGMLNGEQLIYNFNKDGSRYLAFRQVYKNDKLISNIIYYPNGQEKKVLKIGKSYEYYENGNKYAEYVVNENEQIDGQYLGWSNSGSIEVKGFLINGQKDGEWIMYNEDGSIKSKELYELGKKLPKEEERLAEEKRKKEDEERRIEEEKIKQKKAQEEAKERELKELKEKQQKKEEELYQIMRDYNIDKQNTITKYQFWNGSSYAYKKKRLFGYFINVSDYIEKYVNNNNNNIEEKIELAKAGQKIANRMNSLLNQNTKDLEKALKNAKSEDEMIQLFEFKK